MANPELADLICEPLRLIVQPMLHKLASTGLLLMSITILISACAPYSTKYQAPASVEQMLQQCCWTVRAKIGIKQQGKVQSARLNWQQQQDQFTVRLNGPFGVGAIKLSGNAEQVVLEQAGKEPISATSATALLKQNTGISAPLDNLKFWIRGQPATSPVRKLSHDPSGLHLQQFEQDGWLVKLDRYRQFGHYELPGRIEIRAAQAPSAEEQTLTLLISRWTFLGTPEPKQ